MPVVPPVQIVYVVVSPQGRRGHPGVLESNYNLQIAPVRDGIAFCARFHE